MAAVALHDLDDMIPDDLIDLTKEKKKRKKPSGKTKRKKKRRRTPDGSECCEDASPIACPICMMTGVERAEDATRPVDNGDVMILMEHAYDRKAKKAFGHCICPSCWGTLTAHHTNSRAVQGLPALDPPAPGSWPPCPLCRERVTGTSVINCVPIELLEGGGRRALVRKWETQTNMRQLALRRQLNGL